MNHSLFMPHGWCMTWNPWLIALNVVTDALVALSYYSIPAALWFIVWRKRISLSIQPLLVLFALFIALCGGGHFLDIVSIWHPIYWVKGFWNAGTAAASILTAIVLIPRTIEFIKMPEKTERLQREAFELRQQSSLLQTVIDSVEEGILLLDAKGEPLFCNRAAQARLDIDPRAFEWDRHNPSQRELWQSPQGRQIERFTTPIPGYGQLYTHRDVTERLQAEQTRPRLERIVSTMREGFAVIALDSKKIVQTNGSFDRMHGAGDRKLVDGSAESIFFGDALERRRLFAEIQEVSERTGFWDGQTRHSRTDGSDFFCAARFNLYEESGRGFLSCMLLDITDQKIIEEETARVKARLIESAKLESLGVLAGGVAHDFNNLLTGILGNTSLALECLSESHSARPLLQTAIDATERAAKLTNQLLAYSGKGQFVIEPVYLNRLAREISELVVHSIPRTVTIRMELAPSLPFVEADVAQIEQVVMNLVINAGEAIGLTPGTVTLRTGSRALDTTEIHQDFPLRDIPAGDYVWLEVADTGCGMDQTTISQIFDPFFTTKFTGRGLGLAAVQGIVRGHQGALSVRSVKGVGSSFTVYLPALAEGLPAVPVKANRMVDLKGAGTVLVVDDEELVRVASANALKHYGYQVIEAADGLEAIRQFESHGNQIGLVLLDMTMPVMSGEETLARLRERNRSIPVVLISGYSESEAVERFAGQSVAGFIQKPFSAQMLGEKVREFAQWPAGSNGA